MKLKVQVTIDLDDQQYSDCKKLAHDLGYSGFNRTPRQQVIAMLVAAAEDKAYSAGDKNET
jgi:hypothetical protein